MYLRTPVRCLQDLPCVCGLSAAHACPLPVWAQVSLHRSVLLAALDQSNGSIIASATFRVLAAKINDLTLPYHSRVECRSVKSLWRVIDSLPADLAAKKVRSGKVADSHLLCVCSTGSSVTVRSTIRRLREQTES